MVLAPKKSKALDLFAMNFTGFHGVNSGGIHATVTEDISKADDILLYGVIGSGEQVSKVMGKDLLFRYSSFLAELLHIAPYIRSIKRITVFAYKDGTAFYFLLFNIVFEDFAKFSRQKCASTLSFAVNFGSASVNCFNRDKA